MAPDDSRQLIRQSLPTSVPTLADFIWRVSLANRHFLFVTLFVRERPHDGKPSSCSKTNSRLLRHRRWFVHHLHCCLSLKRATWPPASQDASRNPIGDRRIDPGTDTV
jgi:hypothetical protein